VFSFRHLHLAVWLHGMEVSNNMYMLIAKLWLPRIANADLFYLWVCFCVNCTL